MVVVNPPTPPYTPFLRASFSALRSIFFLARWIIFPSISVSSIPILYGNRREGLEKRERHSISCFAPEKRREHIIYAQKTQYHTQTNNTQIYTQHDKTYLKSPKLNNNPSLPFLSLTGIRRNNRPGCTILILLIIGEMSLLDRVFVFCGNFIGGYTFFISLDCC